MSRSRFVACPTVCRGRLAAASVQTASDRRNCEMSPGRDVVHVPLRCARPRRSAPDRPGSGRGRHAREQGPLTIHRSPDPSSPTLRQPAAGARQRESSGSKTPGQPYREHATAIGASRIVVSARMHGPPLRGRGMDGDHRASLSASEVRTSVFVVKLMMIPRVRQCLRGMRPGSCFLELPVEPLTRGFTAARRPS